MSKSQEGISPEFGATNPTVSEEVLGGVQRFASVIGLKPEKEAYYRELHASVWPDVIDRLRSSYIKNYSIYVAELAGAQYLFSYLEYTGDNLERDMAAIASDPVTQRWWQETDPCQSRIETTPQNEQWLPLERVFLML